MEGKLNRFRPGQKLSTSLGHMPGEFMAKGLGSNRTPSLSNSGVSNNSSNNNNNNNNIGNSSYNLSQSLGRSEISEPVRAKYNDFIDVIANTPEYAIALSKKMDSAEMDNTAKSLLNICCYKNTTISLIYGLLRDEFTNNQVNTILRGNSLATKVETAFSRQIGQKYIKELFGDILLRLVTDIGLNLATTVGKVDEEGVKAEVRVEENRQRVLDVAQEFVDRFTSDEMVEKMPRALRSIAGFTAQFAKEYTPDRILPFLGGFMLLRFFNPAIITPESLNMLPQGISPSNQDRQNFIAITRLLQKLSNQVLASDNEDQCWINPFIERNNEKMKQYLFNIIKDPAHPDESFSDLLKEDGDIYTEPQKLNMKNVLFLYQSINEHGIYMLNELSKYPPVMRGDKQVTLSAEFLRIMLALDSSPKSLKLDQLSRKTLFLPTRRMEINNAPIETRLGQSISILQHNAYIFGGNYIDGTVITGEDSILVCNLCTFVWRREGNENAPSRKYHSSVFYNDEIIIFGGMRNKECLNDMHAYNTLSRTWRKIKYENEPALPRYGHSMSILEEVLYIFGGYCFDGKKYFYTNSTYSFNLLTNKWNKIEVANPPSERMHHGCVLYKNSMWIYGGRTPEMEGLDDLYRFDLRKMVWSQIHPQGALPPARWSHSLTLSRNKMILFGGCSDIETFDDAYEFSFDKETLTWENLDYSSPFGPKNYQLADHSAAIYNGRLITMFGGTYVLNGVLTNQSHELCFDLFCEPNASLSEDFKKLINNPFMSDATLSTGNSSFYVHKLILFSRCTQLYNMLENNPNHTLHLDDISEKHLMFILTYLYSGDGDTSIFDCKTILSLLPWCVKLDIPELIRLFELQLIKMVDDKSLMELILLSEKFNLRLLELECIKYFKTTSTEFASVFPFEECSHRVLIRIAHQIFPSK